MFNDKHFHKREDVMKMNVVIVQSKVRLIIFMSKLLSSTVVKSKSAHCVEKCIMGESSVMAA